MAENKPNSSLLAKGSLLDRLYSGNPHHSTLVCNLKAQVAIDSSCCGGRGYKIEPRGAYIKARACECVNKCLMCHGKAQMVQDGFSKPCVTPYIHYTVNLINEARIPSRYAYADLKQFANRSGNCVKVVSQISNWLRMFNKKTNKGLLISGPVGVGKTFILCASALGLLKRGFSVRFVDFFQLISQIKSYYAENKSEAELINPLINVDVLIIDELGKGRNTDFELTILDQLVMGRYNQNKVIVASSNYQLKKPQVSHHHQDLSMMKDKTGFSPDEFDTLEPRVGKRIYSRLLESTYLLELSGDDFRRQGLQ